MFSNGRCILAFLLVLSVSLQWTDAVRKFKFLRVAGRLDYVAVGQCGVWGINDLGSIWYRDGTYDKLVAGTGYTVIGKTDLSGSCSRFTQLDVGTDIVWAVSGCGKVYYREGITYQRPIGLKWSLYLNIKLQYIAVSPSNIVWGCGYNGGLYYYKPGFEQFEFIEGSLIQITTGYSGTWGVSSEHFIYYRVGTYGDIAPGTSWALIPGSIRFKTVTCGALGYVVAVAVDNYVYLRTGITELNPIGVEWERVDMTLTQVSLYGQYVWGLRNRDIYYSDFGIL